MPKRNINEYYQMFFNEIDTDTDYCITLDQHNAALKKNKLVSESFDAEKIKILFDKNVTKSSEHIFVKCEQKNRIKSIKENIRSHVGFELGRNKD
jgi:hypothetical protein